MTTSISSEALCNLRNIFRKRKLNKERPNKKSQINWKSRNLSLNFKIFVSCSLTNKQKYLQNRWSLIRLILPKRIQIFIFNSSWDYYVPIYLLTIFYKYRPSYPLLNLFGEGGGLYLIILSQSLYIIRKE